MPRATTAVTIAFAGFCVAGKVVQRLAFDGPLLLATLGVNQAEVALGLGTGLGYKQGPRGETAAAAIAFAGVMIRF